MSLGERILRLVLSVIIGAIGYGVSKITLFAFTILAEMLKAGMVLTAHNVVIFLGVSCFFVLVLLLTVIAIMLSLSYLIDTFKIYKSDDQ